MSEYLTFKSFVFAADYWPYGEKMAEYNAGGNTGQRYIFTEKERDVESGYDYFGARYYDSDIGRWLSVDPLMDKYPGWSGYNYVMNNPLVLVDPDGNFVVRNGRFKRYKLDRIIWYSFFANIPGLSVIYGVDRFLSGDPSVEPDLFDLVGVAGLKLGGKQLTKIGRTFEGWLIDRTVKYGELLENITSKEVVHVLMDEYLHKWMLKQSVEVNGVKINMVKESKFKNNGNIVEDELIINDEYFLNLKKPVIYKDDSREEKDRKIFIYLKEIQKTQYLQMKLEEFYHAKYK